MLDLHFGFICLSFYFGSRFVCKIHLVVVCNVSWVTCLISILQVSHFWESCGCNNPIFVILFLINLCVFMYVVCDYLSFDLFS